MAESKSYAERHASAAETFECFVPGVDPERVSASFTRRLGALGGMALTLWGPVGVALSAALIAALTLFSVTAAKPEHVGIGQPAHGR